VDNKIRVLKTQENNLSWNSLFLVTFLAAFLFIFSEWLFAITKPSYLNNLGFTQQLQVLVTTSALLACLCLLCLLPLVILGLIPPGKQYTHLLMKLGAWLPAVIFAFLILLMVDNFSYTVFKFGIVSTDGWSRGLYGLGFVLVIFFCYRRTIKGLVSVSRRIQTGGMVPKYTFSVLAGVLLVSLSVALFPNRTRVSPPSFPSTTGAEQRPHILLITADGLDASHMSVYGYERETTPFIQELAKSALVAENAYSNSDKSTGSVISIYTGKYPAKTRVLVPPDVLLGVDSYEHLPGILRSQGYRTVQITFPYYLDAWELNLLDGFDEVKTSSALHTKYLLNTIGKVLPSHIALFTDETIKRVVDRIRHIFFIWKMENPYLLVTEMAEPLDDMERWEILKQEIRTTKQPVFVHVHILGTHGSLFIPQEQNFSAGQSVRAQEPYNIDFYDDSIFNFDKDIGELVDYLTDLDLLDNTILVVGSDHGQKWDQLKRLPLIIRFPYGQYAGRIQDNVQNLDIAPTLLDYIGLDLPDWMHGNSLIVGDLGQRPIFGVNVVKNEESNDLIINWDEASAPINQFDGISLIYCDRWFLMDLTNKSWETGKVQGSTSACPPGTENTDEQAFQWMVEHLQENGFEVSSLERFIP
jgi:arylsulfatase A-like enzyme